LKIKHKQCLKALWVDRRNPDYPVRSLMKARAVLAMIQADSTVNLLDLTGITKAELPAKESIDLMKPQELIIDALWNNKTQEIALTGNDANVFGDLGVLLITPHQGIVHIPVMNALAIPGEFLQKYGAALIPLDEPFVFDTVLHDLYLIHYDFDKDYIDQYVMHPNGGGGLFVETHPFPHLFIPLAQNCGGALILGVTCGDGQFAFAAFSIPYGFTLKIAAHVIHSDCFFVGPYAIALKMTEDADTVIFKQDNEEREIQPVRLQYF